MTAITRSLLRAACAVLALGALASCNTIPKGSGGSITKVTAYKLDPRNNRRIADPTLRFERRYRLYGAVTKAQQLEREGVYMTVFWKALDRSQPVTVRFEYRQRDTGMKVHTLDQEVTDVRRSNVTEFQIVGEAFRTNGPVTAWHATLMRGKEQLGSADSFLWK